MGLGDIAGNIARKAKTAKDVAAAGASASIDVAKKKQAEHKKNKPRN